MALNDPATILVVDDSQTSLNILKDLLQRGGHQVHIASDGKAALELAEQVLPMLILLDVAMPEMDGFQVCEYLKANDETFEIPVIFISGLDDADIISRGFEAGGVDYITKPFKLPEVLARVENQLLLVRQRHQLEAQHIQDLHSYEMLDKMKNQFIGSTVHDLKSPLNIILGYVDLMEKMDHAHYSRTMNNYLQGIRASVRMMRMLVTDMIDWVQMQRGVYMTYSAISLKEFLAACLTDFKLLAAQRHIQLLLFAPDQDFIVRMDSDQMERAVYNLLTNALKYTPEGGQVELHGWCADDQCVIQVRDTGLGIPEEALPQIFEVFYRVPEHSSIEGTGLGLSIAKMIVEQHKGSLRAESQLGIGSVFTISVPL